MYPQNLTYVKPGEPVSASVVNRPVKETEMQVQSLYAALKTSESGAALILRDAAVSPEVQAGMPVYWDTDCFYPAKALAEKNCITGEFESSKCSDCSGLVFRKTSAASADIVLFGVVDLPEVRDHLDVGSGRFYLSLESGKLTFTAPAVQVPVGILIGTSDACDDRTLVYVNPEFAGKVLDHVHYSHDLKPENWKTLPDATNAPENAIMFYDLESDLELRKVFPPIPVESCSVTIDWNGRMPDGTSIEETFGGRDIPVNRPNSLIQVNHDGIWWMSDAIDPSTLTDTDASFRGARVTLHFSRVQYAAQKALVTGLYPDDGQPFEFVDCSGKVSSTGDLFARFTLARRVEDATRLAGTAIQTINDVWVQETAPVIHGVRSSSASLSVSGTPFLYENEEWHGGLVTLTSFPYGEDFELHPQVVKLSEALESFYQNIQYLALPSTRQSAISMKMDVPSAFGESLSVKMRFTFLAKVNGTYPSLNLSVVRLPRPSSGPVSLTGLTSFQPVSIETARSVTANSIFEVESAAIEVSEGDTLIWQLQRESLLGYGSDAGIIRASGILNRRD